jgi:predicted dehydrogenase
MELYGSQGSIFIRSGLGPLAVASTRLSLEGQWLLPDLPRQFLGVLHHQDFVEAVRAAPTPLTARLHDGVRGIEIVTALYRSAEIGRSVSV